MAYNNMFPVNYPAYYVQQPSQQTQTPQQPTQQNNNFIWVQGEAGAKSYLVAPNQVVTLWDSENHTIYLKSADAMGMPSMRILDYTFREPSQTTQNAPQGDFVTQDELASIRQEIVALEAKFEEMKGEKK